MHIISTCFEIFSYFHTFVRSPVRGLVSSNSEVLEGIYTIPSKSPKKGVNFTESQLFYRLTSSNDRWLEGWCWNPRTLLMFPTLIVTVQLVDFLYLFLSWVYPILDEDLLCSNWSAY